MFDGKAFGREIVDIVKGHIDKSMAPIISRIEAIERQVEGIRIPTAEESASVVFLSLDPKLDEIRSSIADVRKSVDEIGIPEPISIDAIIDRIDQKVFQAVGALPKPQDGAPAEPVDMDAVLTEARSAAELAAVKWCEENPPQDGLSVDPDEVQAWVAKAINDGLTKAVAAIPVPKDGVGLAGFIIDRDGHLVATTTAGDVKDLGIVVGKDGKDVDNARVESRVKEQVSKAVAAIPVPKDGKDGFSLKDFDVTTRDDGRTMVLSFKSGDITQEFGLDVPMLIYRGIREEGLTYKRGDVVTWAGSSWHCEEETTDKPGESKSWRLMVKKGRDGKEVVTVSPVHGKPVKVDGK